MGPSSLPLFWRVFSTNAAVLVLAFLALVAAPVTVSVPPHLTELIILTVGLAWMLAISLATLRPAFRPLDELAETMRRHDPLSPGLRARDGDSAVLTVRDDGRGLDADDASSSHAIRGMRERAMLIGAELAIGPPPGRGTEVKLTIPLDPPAS